MYLFSLGHHAHNFFNPFCIIKLLADRTIGQIHILTSNNLCNHSLTRTHMPCTVIWCLLLLVSFCKTYKAYNNYNVIVIQSGIMLSSLLLSHCLLIVISVLSTSANALRNVSANERLAPVGMTWLSCARYTCQVTLEDYRILHDLLYTA